MTPRLSVLLPVRDAAETLEPTLASLQAQTHTDFEVLVQDDGSRDRSEEIARRFAAGDPRFRLEQQPPRGIVAALNAAAKRARGPLLVRMDADDLAHPDRLGDLLAFADTHPDVAFFASRVRYVPREGLSAGMLRYEGWINGLLTHEAMHRDRFVECPLPHPAWAIRRDTFDALGGYREGDFPEDYDLFLRAATAGVRFGKVDRCLLDWRDHPARMSRTSQRFTLDRFFALKVEYLTPLLAERKRDVAVIGGGKHGKRWVRALAAEGLHVPYLMDTKAARQGQTIHGAQVLDGTALDAVRDAFLLVALGRPGARDLMRTTLDAAGLVEETDYLCVQ